MIDKRQGEESSIGLFGAVSIGIGGMVGGGIFAVLGVAATEARGATPLAFLFGGIIAALTAYSYAKLSVRFPNSGGTVAIVDGVFGVSGLTGGLNVILWAGYIATTALYVTAFGNYASSILTGGESAGVWMLRILILIGIAVPWAINLLNAGLIARSEGIVVAIKVLILLVVIAAGIPSISSDRLSPSTWPTPLGIIAAGMLIFVAYEGFELIANAAGEIREPKVTLPRAFALSVGLVIVLYVAIAIVVVGSLDPQEIARASDFALAEAASETLGQTGFLLVGFSAVLATFSAINATLFGAARLSYTIAAEGELPESLEKTTWSQPLGLHITALAGLAIALLLPLGAISGLSSAIFLLVFAVVNAAGFVLLTSPTSRWLCGVGVVGCAGSLIALLVHSWSERPAAVVGFVVLVGAVWVFETFYLRRRRSSQARSSIRE